MQVKIIAVEVTDMTKYKVAEVTYKDEHGDTKTKKITTYSKAAYLAVTSNPPGYFEVDSRQNEKGFWEWISCVPSNGQTPSQAAPQPATQASPVSRSTAPAAAPKSNYETAEERDRKQTLIVRQSSLDRAIEYMELTGNKGSSPTDVIVVAQSFAQFCLDGPDVLAPMAQAQVRHQAPQNSHGEFDDDIPF